MTRLQSLQAKDAVPAMPPQGAAAHLVGYLFECGPMAQGPQGSACLSWQDLQAWQSSTGVELQAWEARGLRRLSFEYLSSAQAAQAHDCPPPWTEEPTTDERTRVANGLRSIFSQLKAQH